VKKLSVKHPKLYEINTATWLYELYRRYGDHFSLGNVPTEEWDRLKTLGFHYVWLMGIWKRSQEGRKYFQTDPQYMPLYDTVLPGWKEDDIIGSPYSIASYEPDPIMGDWQDLDRTRDELFKRGIGLVLDFIPNHTGPDHPWIMDHPDYYIQGSEDDFKRNPTAFFPIYRKRETLYIAKGKDPFFPPWPDTSQLNYFNPEMRSALIEELRKIAEHCDGVRCDMAMLMLNDIFSRNWEWAKNQMSFEPIKTEFWKEVKNAVQDLVLIAEAYWDTEWELQQLGFDYVYDKRLYDLLRNSPAYDVNLHLRAEISYQSKLVRFIENHDEPRSAEVFDRGRLTSSAVLLSTLPGMKLYHHGQLMGRRISVPIFLRRVADEKPDEELKAFYGKLLRITHQDIFSDGKWEIKDVISSGDNSFKNLIAFVWRLKEHMKLVVVNLSPDFSQGRISLHREIAVHGKYLLHDELNVQKYLRNGKEMVSPGLHIILEGFHSHLFEISPEY